MENNHTKEVVTYTVAENGRFHRAGECHEGIPRLGDAVEIFEKYQKQQTQADTPPSLGVCMHVIGTPETEDLKWDFLTGDSLDLDGFQFFPEMKENQEIMSAVYQLSERWPDVKLIGIFPEEISKMGVKAGCEHEAKTTKNEVGNATENSENAEKTEIADKAMDEKKTETQQPIIDPVKLSARIDQFARDFDLYDYEDTVENRERNMLEIQRDLENGDIQSYMDFFTSVIENEEGDGMDQKNAADLLKALEAYKPLAKVEELEEQNDNKLDNVINNAETRDEKEQSKRPEGRYGRFKLCKRKEDDRYLMIADVLRKDGNILKEQVIGEFENKEAAEEYCRQNGIAYEDVTDYLQSRINHKKQKISEQKSDAPKKPAGKVKDNGGLEES